VTKAAQDNVVAAKMSLSSYFALRYDQSSALVLLRVITKTSPKLRYEI